MSDDRDEVGSVGEEAAKLLGALQDWARDTGAAHAGGVADDLGAQVRDLGAHLAHGEDCRYCPVCQAIRVFRETSPEIKQHLATAAGSLAQAVSLYLSASSQGSTPRSAEPQHIDLDDD
ncbi:hypothetical protein [Nocardioides marmoribigeumensis]|uniref:Uncharacterized protein n=1 Tax=Nocardioides marmoribigeumensis TaxID=433649 RepID=A0ABU2BPJ3_9ACTN|nr:hypothetical protein [Nocardioides marmoribigeumensis]MDR7360540.1 hypothetical protein [Nocardioides marmoribigeumensis]